MRSATRVVAALVTGCLLTAAGPALADPRRVAVVVGNNAGMADELELRYAERDARKMGKVLADLGGFDRNQVHLLLGQPADALRELLQQVVLTDDDDDESLADDEFSLLFYYSGHSDELHLHLAGTKVEIAELRELLRGTGARLSIVVLDSCRSGAITRAKGATLGPAYEIDLIAGAEVEGQIIITSSSADEISQESDKLEGSFFTHHLVSGLYGAADANKDSLVTLEEAYRYAHFCTVEHTIESRGGVQHPTFRFDLVGQGNVVLANLSRSTARVDILGSAVAGEYFILDMDKQLVLTEVLPQPGGLATISLPPGEYRIRKREPNRFLVADVIAKADRVVRVRDAAMRAEPYADESVKGVTVRRVIEVHGPLLGVSLRTRLIPEMGAATVIRIGYQLGGPLLFVEPRAVLRFAPIEVEGTEVRHREFDFGLALGLRNPQRQDLRLALALDWGLALYHQEPTPAISLAFSPPAGAIPVAMQAALLGRVGFRLAPPLTFFVSANGGVAVFSQDDQVKAAPIFGGGACLEFGFR